MKRHWAPAFAGATVLLVAAAAAIWWLMRLPAPEPLEAVAPPAPALARLTRGVNLSNWLQHGRPTEARRYAPDAADFQRIRALGLAHVRLPVDPAALIGPRGLPDPKAFATLRAAIEDARRADLLTVLVVQLPPEAKAGIATRATDRAALAGTWRWLAGALRDIPPTHLAFEPLNEPEIADAAASRALLGYLAGELRAVVPEHTLVVSGHRYSGLDELTALRPLEDRNVVYAFHFYEPHNFTHQGANWGDPAWRLLRNFPYPSSPESVAGRMDATAPEVRGLLRWHGEERWNRERVQQRLTRAAQWSRRYKVPVWCSEFGVLKTHVAAGERAAWLNDVRVALEEDGIGWTHWDYAGDFGLVGGPRGRRVTDAQAARALGLKGE
jgi:endoglucanase